MSISLTVLLLLFPLHPVTGNPASPFQIRDQEKRLIRQFYPDGFTRRRAERAKKTLLKMAAKSPESRTEVISALIATLQQADVPAFPDHATLWMYVCDVLGELRSTEAIDVLISHPSDSKGLSSLSLSLRPSLTALISIGQQAIPKLEQALVNQDNSMLCRIQAVDALRYIGGGDARKALEKALANPMNQQLHDHIEFALAHLFDINQAVIVGSSVMLINQKSRREQKIATSDEGQYRLDRLEPGT